jgi:hypothetical protein
MTAALRTALLALALGGVLAGCAPPAGPPPTAQQMAACRQRADEVWERNNRGEIYRADVYASGTRDAMFSSSGSPNLGVRELQGRFARDQILSDCLRAVAGNVGSNPDSPTAPMPAATGSGVMPRGQALPPPGLGSPSR